MLRMRSKENVKLQRQGVNRKTIGGIEKNVKWG